MRQAKRSGLKQASAEAQEALPAPVVALQQRQPDGAVGHAPARSPLRLTMSGEKAAIPYTRQGRTRVKRALAREAEYGRAFLVMPVAIGAGAGLVFMSAKDPDPALLLTGLIVALALFALAGKARPAAALIAGIMVAGFAGAVAASFETRNGVVLLDSDVTTTVTGTVEAREFDDEGRVRYLIRLSSTREPEIRRPPGRIRVVARAKHAPIAVGEGIEGRARLRTPSGPALPGGYDFAFKAFADGIGAHGFFYRSPARLERDPGQQPADMFFLSRALDVLTWRVRKLREHISQRFRKVLPGDPGGIAAALAVSDRRGISEATVEALRATGLAHILAISGLHMALAAGTLFLVIRKGLAVFPALAEAFPVKKIAAVGALLAATAYLMISGGSVSTQRAWVMLAIMLIAVLADRAALTMRNVAFAAIVIVLFTPSAVVGPGFQMSFAATAALISVYAAIARSNDPSKRAAALPAHSTVLRWGVFFLKAAFGLALTSLVAGLATGIFSAHHFHRLAGNGILANVLAMPLVTFVVMPAGLVSLLLMPFGFETIPLKVMGMGLEGVIAVANYVDGLGGDIVVGQIPIAATATAGAGLITLAFLCSWLRYAGLALIVLGGALALPPLRSPPPDMLISEDGGLVALRGTAGLSGNLARPNDFIIRQWLTALRAPDYMAPLIHLRDGGDDDPASLDFLLASANAKPQRFHCLGRGVCAAVHSGAKILAIDRPALIGAACDRADIVVVAIPVYMRNCRSGAEFVTARSLRRTGALSIVVKGNVSADGAAAGFTRDNNARPVLMIETALGGVVRPWTVQRYYDWRTSSYDLPD